MLHECLITRPAEIRTHTSLESSLVSHRLPPPLDQVDGLDHVESQLHAALGVIGPGDGEAGNAVVTVTQELDAETVVLLKER